MNKRAVIARPSCHFGGSEWLGRFLARRKSTACLDANQNKKAIYAIYAIGTPLACHWHVACNFTLAESFTPRGAVLDRPGLTPFGAATVSPSCIPAPEAPATRRLNNVAQQASFQPALDSISK
jgi:hypothetical protein